MTTVSNPFESFLSQTAGVPATSPAAVVEQAQPPAGISFGDMIANQEARVPADDTDDDPDGDDAVNAALGELLGHTEPPAQESAPAPAAPSVETSSVTPEPAPAAPESVDQTAEPAPAEQTAPTATTEPAAEEPAPAPKRKRAPRKPRTPKAEPAPAQETPAAQGESAVPSVDVKALALLPPDQAWVRLADLGAEVDAAISRLSDVESEVSDLIVTLDEKIKTLTSELGAARERFASVTGELTVCEDVQAEVSKAAARTESYLLAVADGEAASLGAVNVVVGDDGPTVVRA